MERAHDQFVANSLLRVIAGKIAGKKPGNFLFRRKPAWIVAMRKEAGNLQGICRQFYLRRVISPLACRRARNVTSLPSAIDVLRLICANHLRES